MSQQFFEPDALNPDAYENFTPRVVQARQLRQSANLNILFAIIGFFILLVIVYALMERYKSLHEEVRNS